MMKFVRIPLAVAVVAFLLAATYFTRPQASQPAPAAATITSIAPWDDWSGVWLQEGDSALLRLQHARSGGLDGVYAPADDRAHVYHFYGRVQGASARFDLSVKGKLWHCTLNRSGETVTLWACQDVQSLLNAYENTDRVNGMLVIHPRKPEARAKEAADLAEKRAALRDAAIPTSLGTFERVEVLTH